MDYIEIKKNSNVVKTLVAQAKHESVDSDVAKRTNEMIAELAKEPNPHNRYQIAQLIGFAVNEIVRPKTNWLDQIADTKRVGYGEKAQFKVRQEGIRAYVGAKGGTPARSKVANKTITLDTVAVSARPSVNLVEMQNGQADMAALINDAAYQMELAYYQYIQGTMNAALGTAPFVTPYYGTGSGIVKATLDPMIRHWMRMSGGAAPTLLGDIDMVSQLAELTGFTASTTSKQFSDSIMDEYNATGMIGVYGGCKVVNLVNPLIDGTDTPVFDTNKLFILPSGIDAGMRPLKVLFEGDVTSKDNQDIDDMVYEVRLDQYIGAGIVVGDRPYIGVYQGN